MTDLPNDINRLEAKAYARVVLDIGSKDSSLLGLARLIIKLYTQHLNDIIREESIE